MTKRPRAEVSEAGRILHRQTATELKELDLRPFARALVDLALQLLKDEREAIEEERKAA